jgi:hypothetical protein
MKLMSRLAVVGASIVMGTSAFANYTATVGTWAYINGQYMYVTPGSAYAQQGDGAAAADTNSTAVTERTVALESTKAQIDLITEHLDTVAPTPIAAGGNSGGSEHRFNVFAKVRWDKLKENFTNADWNADLWTGALGGDYKFNDYVTAGLAFTYSHLKGDTKFNNGKIKDNAWGFVPYIRVTASDMFSFDLYAGYTRANKDRTRQHLMISSTNVISNVNFKSSPKSDRYFFAAYANAKHKVQQFNLLGRLGIVHVEDRQKAFNETGSNGTVFTYRSNATKVTQAVVRAQAGFQASEYVEPYIFLTYGYTFSATKMRVADSVSITNTGGFTYKSPNSETTKHQIGGGLGLNMNINKSFSAKVEGNLSQAKKTKTYGATAGVIYKW